MIYKISSPAKINLGLKILNKRADGFHNIETTFQFLNWGDDITIETKVNKNQIVCPSVEEKENIVSKLINLLKNTHGFKENLKVTINKRIPLKSGLGGGSSNAASVLVAINKIFNLNLSKKKLIDLALVLGSDVPIFVHGKSSIATGRGEIFKKVSLVENPVIVIIPNSKVSTKLAFKNFNNIETIKYSNKKNFNSFENWIRKNFSEIDEIFNFIENYNDAHLSGTGSAIYSMFNNFEEAQKIIDNAPSNMNCFLTTTLNNSPIKDEIKNYGV